MRRLLVLAVGLLVLSALGMPSAVAAWTTVTLNNFGDSDGPVTSLAISPVGGTFVAYTAGGDDLFWAKKTSTGWNKTQVAGRNTFVGCYNPDIEFDGPAAAFTSAGEPRIASACQAVTGGSPVKFTRRVSGEWKTKRIGATGQAGVGSSSATSVDLALTVTNKPHVVVASLTGGMWRFRQVNGTWVRQTLVAETLCCDHPVVSATIHPTTGRLVVAWNSDAYGGTVLFAEFDGNGDVVGSVEVVFAQDIVIDTAAYGIPSLAFNSEAEPVVALQSGSETTKSISLATRESGVWTLDDALDATTADVGADPSLVIASDVFHVAYHDGTNGDLKYASSPDGTTWTIETIAATGDIGEFPSLGVTSSGKIKIAHYDRGDTALRFTFGP